MNRKQDTIFEAVLAARDILLEELKSLSKAIDRVVELADITVELDDEGIPVFPADMVSADAVIMGYDKNANDEDVSTEKLLISSSKHDILQYFHSLGSQILHLWNTFLKFHRANKTSILEYLRDAWGADHRAEWSMWMVYTKIDMPHHYIHCGADESSHHPRHRRVSSLWKLGNDPAQSAALRAELHQRSIAQMKDMHIFGDPSRIAIVIVERVVNAPSIPYHSARIELCQASSSDNSKKSKIFLEMLNNCVDQIRAPSSKHRVFSVATSISTRPLRGGT